MEKVFIDSDIILDLLMKRDPYYNSSIKLFNLIENKKIEGFVSPLIFSNLFYIIRKLENREKAINSLKKLKILVRILPVDEKVIDLALSSNLKDFEDAIQYYTALKNGINNLITRNTKDYKLVKINLFTADEYVKIFEDKFGGTSDNSR
jgi:predicted nucleic acid-binding protein